jgi:hypothetical protein
MSDKSRIHSLSLGKISQNILASKAITHSADFDNPEFGAETFDCGVDDWFDACCLVKREPGLAVEVFCAACEERLGDGVPFEYVGNYDEVACAGEVIGEAEGYVVSSFETRRVRIMVLAVCC